MSPQSSRFLARPQDAYWVQTIRLGPGYYHFIASIRAEEVAENSSGANLSIVEDGIISPRLRGTADWTTVGFYLKVSQAATEFPWLAALVGLPARTPAACFAEELKPSQYQCRRPTQTIYTVLI